MSEAEHTKEKIADLEQRLDDMLSLVRRVAELHLAATNPVTTQKLRDEARRILGRSE